MTHETVPNPTVERRSREDQDDRRERVALERRSREDQDDRRERVAVERRSREDQDDRRERVALEATLLPRSRPAVAPKVRARVETGESLLVVMAKGTRNRPGSEAQVPRSSR